MTQEYTKGEWEVLKYDDYLIISDNGNCVATIHKTYYPEAQLPNARLIAQAPRLYEALKELCDGIDNGKEVVGYGHEQKIRQALTALEEK